MNDYCLNLIFNKYKRDFELFNYKIKYMNIFKRYKSGGVIKPEYVNIQCNKCNKIIQIPIKMLPEFNEAIYCKDCYELKEKLKCISSGFFKKTILMTLDKFEKWYDE